MVRGRAREKTPGRIYDFLKEKDKEIGFEEIANYCRKFGIYRSTVKDYLDKMKNKGYVKQSPDGRHPYKLTPKGNAFFLRKETLRDINNILNFTTIEEMKEILQILEKSDALVSNLKTLDMPSFQNLGLSSDDIIILQRILTNIDIRRRIKKLQEVKAPDEIISIGSEIIKGKRPLDALEFFYYPTSKFDIQVWDSLCEYFKDKLGMDFAQIIKKGDPEYYEMVQKKRMEILNE